MLNHSYLIDSANALRIPVTERDPLSIMCRFMSGFFSRDRFNILNKYSPLRIINTTDPLPKPFESTVSLSDIMDETAQNIIQKVNGGKIIVCWSGGVDSTAVVVSFLRNLPINGQKQLIVLGNEHSVLENKSFYHLLKNNNVSLILSDTLVEDLKEEECTAITSGWCADQLFGSDIHLIDPSFYNKSPIEAIPAIWQKKFPRSSISKESAEILFSIYKEYGKHLGLEIEQFCEMAWLHNFGVKWTFISNFMDFKLFQSSNENKAIPFFTNLDFQRWSISNFENIRKKNVFYEPGYYKRALKQYIYDFDNDGNYYSMKGKKNSWATIMEEPGIRVKTDQGIKLFDAVNKKGERCPYCYGELAKQVFNSFRK